MISNSGLLSVPVGGIGLGWCKLLLAWGWFGPTLWVWAWGEGRVVNLSMSAEQWDWARVSCCRLCSLESRQEGMYFIVLS